MTKNPLDVYSFLVTMASLLVVVQSGAAHESIDDYQFNPSCYIIFVRGAFYSQSIEMSEKNNRSDDDTWSMGSSMGYSIPTTHSAEEGKLSWRSDPWFNFSDWTIRVTAVVQDDTESRSDAQNDSSTSLVEIYHVHRNILAIGERRSGYFGNLFHYGIDDGDHCTNVELSPRAALFFPDLLDYMYHSRAFCVSTRNAIALLFLSQAFQIHRLQDLVESFIEGDINLLNFGYYMSEALYYSDEKMAMKIMDKYGKEVLQFCGNYQQLSNILRAPLCSTAKKAKETCRDAWTFLTGAPRGLVTPIMERVRNQKLPSLAKLR